MVGQQKAGNSLQQAVMSLNPYPINYYKKVHFTSQPQLPCLKKRLGDLNDTVDIKRGCSTIGDAPVHVFLSLCLLESYQAQQE